MKTRLLFSGLLAAAVSLSSCEDALQEVANPNQAAATDGKKVPDAYQAVNIDVLRVEISQDAAENTSRWTTLADVQPGMRNLLNTGTAAAPLFTSAAFQTGSIKQIRLVLGNNSNLKLADGRTVALDTPSGQTSGLKVKIDQTVQGGQRYAVLVSIDPNWQVVAKGTGSYSLKPVLDGSLVAAPGWVETE